VDERLRTSRGIFKRAAESGAEGSDEKWDVEIDGDGDGDVYGQ
jgi:hypothetical protein